MGDCDETAEWWIDSEYWPGPMVLELSGDWTRSTLVWHKDGGFTRTSDRIETYGDARKPLPFTITTSPSSDPSLYINKSY